MNMTEFIEQKRVFSPGILTSAELHNKIIRILISTFIFSLVIWLFSDIYHLFHDIFINWDTPWGKRAEEMIINTLGMLALLEIIRTLQCYLEIGRVRVTFILDAALTTLIGELIGLWYREYQVIDIIVSMGVIITLVILRIVTTTYSPDKNDEMVKEG